MTDIPKSSPKKKNWRSLRLSLKYRPEIFRLILKMRQCIRKKNKLLKSVSQRLAEMNLKKYEDSKTIDIVKENKTTQTASSETLEKKEKTESIPNTNAGWGESGDQVKSIAEQVKEVAQSALQETGMVYVESAGMYYDYKTGYYYNSELGVYYHTDTGCYYTYSDEKQQFQFHSYPDTSSINTSLVAHQKKKARKLKRERKPEDDIDNLTKNLAQDNSKSKRRKKVKKETEPAAKDKKETESETNENGADLLENGNTKEVEEEGSNKESKEVTIEKGSIDLEDGECSDTAKAPNELEDGECSDTASDSDCESVVSTSTVSDEDCIAKHHPPCMRVIVRETNLPKLKVGSLFLITKDGGTVGREGDQHTIVIRDHNVSRTHLDIKYDMSRKTYVATDLGSKNGTVLNGTRMSESQETSLPMEILHGSTIQLGETKLLCHIHPGNDTCGHCEPGLLMEAEEKEKKAYTRTCSVQKQHQLELARLKNIYAPRPLALEEAPYNDRAQARRRALGSTHHAEKTHATDLDTCISQDNKGFKLLQKMGWSKGEGLGKDNQGETEPVPLVSNEGKSGLGTSGAVGTPAPMPARKVTNTIASATMRLAARTKMLQPPAKAFQDTLDEDSE